MLPRQLGAVGVCISKRASNAPFSVIQEFEVLCEFSSVATKLLLCFVRVVSACFKLFRVCGFVSGIRV